MRSLQSVPRIGNVDADHPNGKIIDSQPAQGGDPAVVGTAIVDALHGDFIQLLQRLIIDANITPNGLPDNVSNGYQLLEAFNAKVLQTALASSSIARTAFDNVFAKLNTQSFSNIDYDGNAAAMVYVGDSQTVFLNMDGQGENILFNGVQRSSGVDVPVGTRITITFHQVEAGTALRIDPSGLSGFVFGFGGFTGASLPLVVGVDNTFTFKFEGVVAGSGGKKLILIESAPTFIFSQVDGKADETAVILKGGGDSYTPVSDTDPVNRGNVRGELDVVSTANANAGSGVVLHVSLALRYRAFVFFHLRYTVPSSPGADDVIATFPSNFPPASARWEFIAGNRSSDTKEVNTLYIAAGSRSIRLLRDGDDGIEFTMSGFYPVSING